MKLIIKNLINDSYLSLILCVLVSGLALSLLTPIGLFLGTDSLAYNVVFLIHLALHALALIYAYKNIKLFLTSKDKFSLFFVAFFIFISLIIIMSGTLPATNKDVLIHHLSVAKYWLKGGEIFEIPWHSWNYFPSLIQTAYLGFLSFDLEFFCNWYHFSYLIILSTIISGSSLLENFTNKYRIFTFLLVFSLPLNLNLATTAMVDLALAVFTSIGISLLFNSKGKTSYLAAIFAGLSFGLAISTKYNALLAVGLIVPIFCCYDFIKERSIKRVINFSIIFAFVILLAYFPVGVKNLTWKGNPFFPFLSSIFKSSGSYYSNINIDVSPLSPIQKRIQLWDESFLELITIPIRMILFGQDENPKYFDAVLSPILILLFLPLFFLKDYKHEKKLLYAFYIYLLAYTVVALISTSARSRYLIPLIFPSIILVAYGIRSLEDIINKKNVVLISSTFIQLVFALYYLYNLSFSQKKIDVILGKLDKSAYLSQSIIDYPMIDWLNKNVSERDKIFLIYTANRFYYFNGNIEGDYFSYYHLITWLNNSNTAQEVAIKARQKNIKYLAANKRNAVLGLDSSLKESKKILWNDFGKNYLKVVYEDRFNIVWQVQ